MITYMINYLIFFFVLGCFFYFYNKQTKIETFISSEGFEGAKNGYVFKNDNKGLGYYIDKKY
jgi:hypothetical protein